MPSSSTSPVKFAGAKGPLGWLSNFTKAPVKINGKEWPTVEHYFQAQKFAGTKYEDMIRGAKTAAEAKKMGGNRKWPLRKDWDKVKESVMREAVEAKFTQHPELRAKLMETGGGKITENVKWDKYWGDGGDGSGKNRLGHILMDVRKKLGDEASTGHRASQVTAQKKIVFKGIDLKKFKRALRTPQRYAQFIIYHEEAHKVLGHTKNYPKDLLDPKAIAMEIEANQYAAKKLGIDLDNLDASLDKPPLIQVFDDAMELIEGGDVGLTGEARAVVKELLGEELLAKMKFANDEHASDVLDTLVDELMHFRSVSKSPDEFKEMFKTRLQQMLSQRQRSSLAQQRANRTWNQIAETDGFRGLVAKLVGSFEKGIRQVGESVAHSIQRSVGQKVGALEGLIDDLNVRNLWESNDRAFMDQVMWHAKDLGEIPKGWTPVKGAKEVGHGLRILNDEFYAQMTSKGADIGYLKTHGGLTQRYDQKLMGKVSKDQWIDEMIGDGKNGYLDLEETFKSLPWLRNGSMEDLRGYLSKFYDDVKQGHLREQEVIDDQLLGGNLNNQVAKRRSVL
jgi:ribA/ribD-fused uncharacterized protein